MKRRIWCDPRIVRKDLHCRLLKAFVAVTCAPLLCGANSMLTQQVDRDLGQTTRPDEQKVSTDEHGLQPLVLSGAIPETQLWPGSYVMLSSPVLDEFVVTGGWMEPKGHSWKPETYGISGDAPEELQLFEAGYRNLGIDYVVGASKQIESWWSGTVTQVGWEGGYGWRCHVAFDVMFEFQGEFYPVYGAYAHGESFAVEPEQVIEQGEVIGVMGSSGGDYPEHVDFRTWIWIDGLRVDVSPNAIELQLLANFQ